MNHRKLRSRLLTAGTLGVAAMTAALTMGVGAAYAGNPSPPNLNTYPRWYSGQAESIRNAGSDTIFFLTQTMADYYEQSGLYGCNENSAVSPNYSLCLTGAAATTATTDVTDNYDHTEVTVGLGKIGSGDGQKQLCGAESAEFPVDYARSSKPPSSSNGCSTLVGLGFAKDGVPSVDFPDASGPGTATSQLPNVTTAGKIVGPVAAGWKPGDPVTCNTGAANSSSNPLNRTSNAHVGILANSCSGVPLESLDNNDPITVDSTAVASTAYGIYCQQGAGQITDWGQLTNLTGSEVPGEGAPIGVKIIVVGVNTGSGTEATFTTFALSGQTSGPCSGSSGNVDANAFNPGGSLDAETGVLENNSAQLGQFAADDFTASDSTRYADQAAMIASSLYFISNGVYNSNIHARIVTISNGTEYAANKMLENEVIPTTTQSGTLMNNSYPTARTLYNVYRTDTVRDSTASFLNWICDANNTFQKGTDLYTGKSYDTELTTAINTTYGFIRLTDTTASPNNSCQLINVPGPVADATAGSGSTTLTSASNAFPTSGSQAVEVGEQVFGSGITSPDYVAASPAPTASSISLTSPTTGSVSGVTFGLANRGCAGSTPPGQTSPEGGSALPNSNGC